MSLASALAAAALGNVPKALLVIHHVDSGSIDSTKVAANTQNALTKAASTTGVSTPSVPTFQEHTMVVQYNPSTLSLQANAEAIPFGHLLDNVDSGIPSQNLRPPMVVLSVELLFDAMNPEDAFMMDKMRLPVGKIVSDVSGIVQNVKHGGYTVQPQTDGLVAALLRPETRVVTFRWADMAFTGQLIEVRADYTMFSVSGKPIRSKVSMSIAQQVESDADIAYWDKALEKVFGKMEHTVLAELKDSNQKVSNLLNLDSFF